MGNITISALGPERKMANLVTESGVKRLSHRIELVVNLDTLNLLKVGDHQLWLIIC